MNKNINNNKPNKKQKLKRIETILNDHIGGWDGDIRPYKLKDLDITVLKSDRNTRKVIVKSHYCKYLITNNSIIGLDDLA